MGELPGPDHRDIHIHFLSSGHPVRNENPVPDFGKLRKPDFFEHMLRKPDSWAYAQETGFLGQLPCAPIIKWIWICTYGRFTEWIWIFRESPVPSTNHGISDIRIFAMTWILAHNGGGCGRVLPKVVIADALAPMLRRLHFHCSSFPSTSIPNLQSKFGCTTSIHYSFAGGLGRRGIGHFRMKGYVQNICKICT